MNPAEIVLIEDNAADVFLIELALKENGIDPPAHTIHQRGGGRADSLQPR